ncbi:hypothetical protein [Flavivirga algicola]|uniref:Aminoglycoside phosphotransferase domain-containing protein n=1 Tax=Flavivirga algicola TaxID=2729136 RepID=A0ABX1RX99_9FLAO|nr:hypothetical protein [Flavivirga algicola]NMH87635.1 hypothetical protein [Flavivirga algicola]
MRDISFFSEDRYVYLPSTKNPKVILAVSNAEIARNAHKLYNPFSFKAKVLKKISRFLFVSFNGLMLNLIKVKPLEKSDFINYLENKLQTRLTVSIYHATVKDKVVLQLQSGNQICGYLKFPLNTIGQANIEIEKNAIRLLSEKKIVKPCVVVDQYNNIPYFIMSELKGQIESLTDEAVVSLVSRFKKEKKFKLIEHPRVKELYKELKALGLKSYKLKMDSIVRGSTVYYYEVFEHGDFAPWNIVKTDEGLVPFDFEFFVENGIEYFDLIKYHFQVGRLLKKKKPEELSGYIFNKLKIPEVSYIVSLFLVKEIIRLMKAEEPYQFQENVLNHICE